MQLVIDWIVAHQAIVAGAVVAILDLVFALNEGAKSNGLLDWVYKAAKSLVSKDQKPQA